MPTPTPEAAGATTRVAAIDLGTNSTRLLVADVDAEGRITEIERRSDVTRMGRGVELTNAISGEAINDVAAVVADYVPIYEHLEPDRVSAFATSAVRDASNGEVFIAELRERFGIQTRLLRGDEEAGLTYMGATAGRTSEQSTLVCDIGGGSTELIVGRGFEVVFFSSLQVGVVRHSERHIKQDPPGAAELEALAEDVHRDLAALTDAQNPLSADVCIAVAGTATSLAAIDLELEPYDPDRVHGHRLALERIQHIHSQLASVPLAERERIPGLQPGRAPTIVTGVVILIGVMRAFGMHEIEISERDILHGVAIDTVRSGAGY